MEKKGRRFFSFQEHEDDEEIILIKNRKKAKMGNKTSLVPKWVYRVSLILLLAVLVLVWWFNRENLTVENISDWVQTRVVGMGIGDGYPVSIPGGVAGTHPAVAVVAMGAGRAPRVAAVRPGARGRDAGGWRFRGRAAL